MVALAYQEDDGDVEEEGDHGVGDEDADAHILHLAPAHARDFEEERDGAVHDGADGGEVVQAHERVHLELRAGEQLLHHDEARGFEDDAAALEEEADHDEFDFADGGDHDAHDDEGDVAQCFEGGLGDAEDPGGDEGYHGHGGLGSH